MKAIDWLALCFGACLLEVAAGPIAAGQGVAEPLPSPAGAPPRALGVLAPIQAEVQVVVPKDGLWPAPEAGFVLADSISVQPPRGPALVRREKEPRLGQFSCRPDGVVVFGAADVGRQFVVRYQFRPRRVALLDAASPADNADAQSLLGQFLAEELGKHGCVVVPAPEVRDAAAALSLGTISPHVPPPPEKCAALAQQTDAAYVLVPGIAIREYRRPDEVDTGIPLPRGTGDRPPKPFYEIPGEKVERSARPLFEEEPTLMLPITRSRLYGAVRLAVIDGANGAVAGNVTVSSFQRVRLRRFTPARRSLVQRLAAQAVAAWRGPAQ